MHYGRCSLRINAGFKAAFFETLIHPQSSFGPHKIQCQATLSLTHVGEVFEGPGRVHLKHKLQTTNISAVKKKSSQNFRSAASLKLTNKNKK